VFIYIYFFLLQNLSAENNIEFRRIKYQLNNISIGQIDFAGGKFAPLEEGAKFSKNCVSIVMRFS